MNYFLIIILMIISSSALAGTMTAKTGYGYITDSNGHIIAKEELYPGTYPLTDGYKYTEVADKSSLMATTVYTPPETPQQQQVDLNAKALQEVIANQIANDPQLATQQAAITKSLNTSQVQTK